MILGIDIGNTQTKIAVYENNKVKDVFYSPTDIFHKKIFEIDKKKQKVSEIIISSVGFLEKKQIEELSQTFKIHQISHLCQFPFENKYKTPQTLGIDRMVLASGACLMYPNENVLIIDAGTCITYDFVSKENEYLGGGISPGINLRYLALHDYTAKLPKLKQVQEIQLIGKTTEESMHSGVINGVVAEIDGIINQYRNKYKDLTIILTGGDAIFLSMQVKNSIFVHSFFLLESLNLLYHYTKKK